MASRRTLLLDNTERLIAARGYHAVSIQDVARETGVTTAAIFHHFPSKAELVACSLSRAGAKLAETLEGLNVLPARERLRGWVEAFAVIYLDKNLFCMCGMLSAERQEVPPEIAAAIEQFVSFALSWLTRVASELAPNETDPAQLARAILAATEGGMLVARMTDQKTHFRQSTHALINALIPAAALSNG